ncbi:monodechloroaminopyrrolnitrin synthase PrnB family protein [Streptomyces sp. NPDC053048]|uniref:monodechloroaminopyrrolnitrin synthase PrnB family protein n=1 Tax=Streptomyces sp. NPDC053048 TaxID=3365694 RepID=UPI0037D48FFC
MSPHTLPGTPVSHGPMSDGTFSHGDPLQNERVRALDPLGADQALATLPELNGRADVPALAAMLRELLPHERDLAGYSTDECLAVMRDLGMLLGSIKRHDETEPAGLVPEVVPVLRELGRRTGMVPRDTVHHYTTWNPTGARQRMYTGDPQESCLQESVRMVFPRLRSGLELCDVLAHTDPTDGTFATVLDELTDLLGAMVDSIDMVVQEVSPAFFARVLRPYYENVTLDGRSYLGPAAAQVPLWLIDLAVWASDHSEPGYQEFLAESIPYSLPRWRELYASWLRGPSLVGRLVEAFGDDPGERERSAPQLLESAEALLRLLRVIMVFRGRHLGIARKAYQEDVRLFPVGSGGASVELLKQILDLTRDNANLTRGSAHATRDAGQNAKAAS